MENTFNENGTSYIINTLTFDTKQKVRKKNVIITRKSDNSY